MSLLNHILCGILLNHNLCAMRRALWQEELSKVAGSPEVPYTLHPTPYTHAPYTLHPTPHTLHPTLYTLHPTPIHPTPYMRTDF